MYAIKKTSIYLSALIIVSLSIGCSTVWQKEECRNLCPARFCWKHHPNSHLYSSPTSHKNFSKLHSKENKSNKKNSPLKTHVKDASNEALNKSELTVSNRIASVPIPQPKGDL